MLKLVNVPQRLIPYHLRECAQKAMDTMVKEDVIEKHSENKPAPWISTLSLPQSQMETSESH